MTDMVKKKYRVYERCIVEREIQYCEECDFSNYTYDGGRKRICGASCMLFQNYLESEGEHIPIPPWCKIDQTPYALNGRGMN